MSVATSTRRESATTLTKAKARRGRKTKDELRWEYALIQRKFLRWFSKNTLDAAVRSKVATLMAQRGKRNASPELWVEAIKLTTLRCDHCDGSGTYRWGASVNGKMSKSGSCFRCQGKGRMDADDCVRTATYHNHLKVY